MTPRTITVEDLSIGNCNDWNDWCFQVKKEGFQASKTISRFKNTIATSIFSLLLSTVSFCMSAIFDMFDRNCQAKWAGENRREAAFS
jgi:hypothetical protein